MAGSRPRVEPVPNAPAATVDLNDECVLVVGDYHAGIEAGLRYERGVELPSNAAERRHRLEALLEQTAADRLVVLGDFGHRIGSFDGDERNELNELYTELVDRRGIPITITPGNHDGGLDAWWGDRKGVDIRPQSGSLLGVDDTDGPLPVGMCHGHTWPDSSLLSADVICMAHEHPMVKLQDRVGGYRTEKVWLRGRLDRAVLAEGIGCDANSVARPAVELVVMPAFNARSGGTWVNVDGEGFLSPFLPNALVEAELYLLDGTRLGAYRDI